MNHIEDKYAIFETKHLNWIGCWSLNIWGKTTCLKTHYFSIILKIHTENAIVDRNRGDRP